ncbi:hypothetical protein [Mycobacteroides salmoniphilum]|uniref:hypothetical protein n=1 Tax=Mycobacteroides salmoniphilum TaxID=404941 RepID=UPI000993AB6D|nr:hypothetical protein [Mycobacteroides salmoniphilum]
MCHHAVSARTYQREVDPEGDRPRPFDRSGRGSMIRMREERKRRTRQPLPKTARYPAGPA